MQSTDQTGKIVSKLSRMGINASVAKSRVALWKALQSRRETNSTVKVAASYHP